MKSAAITAIVFSLVLFSCFPDDMGKQMGEAIAKSNIMMSDMQFKSALNNIELYKLRTGSYPDSLGEITFVSDMDRGNFRMVEYTRLEDKYELNLKVVAKGVEYYPDEFWTGLGCIRSNMMKPGTAAGTPLPDSTQPADSLSVR